MDFGINPDQIENLAKMLDPELQKRKDAGEAAIPNRPSTQLCGYSLSEAKDPSKKSTLVSYGEDPKTEKPTGAPMNPGFVSLPPKLAHQQEAAQAGLPIPSQTTEGKAFAARIQQETQKKKPAGNAIWDEDEVDPSFGAGAGEKEIAPSRQIPEYQITFKHNVSTEDRFLGMDFTRDGSANTADGVIVKVEMPKQTSAKDIDLDVKESELSLLSPLYRLKVPLPLKVLTNTGISAQWDKGKKTLTVTMSADKSKREIMLM
jgi:hypothetical protein